MTQELSNSERQAMAQLEGIKAMVAALECDYERLEELREERDTWVENDGGDEDEQARTNDDWAKEFPEEARELADLEAEAGDCESDEQARERIQEDPLSLEVRSGWTAMGEKLEAEEYCILLCTGGPACRIVGDLDGGEPTSARLQHQDWGTPWTEFFLSRSEDEEALLAYVRCFYFGE